MDNIFTHILAGLGAGVFAICIGSPIDVVRILSPFSCELWVLLS